MNKKCMGCGSVMQDKDTLKEGYTINILDNALCQRCFKIKYYGTYLKSNKETSSYDEIFNGIKDKKDLILYLCDIFTLDDSLKNLNEFKGKVLLIITKKDLLPKSVKEEKLINYIRNNYSLNIEDIVFVSSKKNYNLDLLMRKINKYKTSDKVYLVGNTNAGKSTLLNRIIKSYSSLEKEITESNMPETTLDLIEIKIDDNLTIIDTPGIVSDDNYLYDLDQKNVKKVSPKTEVKPRTFQLKKNSSLLIGDYARIDYLSDWDNSFTIYLSNEIDVSKINFNTNTRLRNLKKHSFDLSDKKDIVINGLLFCKIVKKAKVDIYVKKNVKVFERNNLI